ncbi:putative membrane protein [Tsukamurella ocularis]|uniref:alpha/beta hydrolase n=1 Tax=Tsukamurella ocularis TaxID=1970234 RepID=UPI0021681E7E|nr:alpha/beta hydrolase [Tsukamurella ocularis]MCS3788840.1 putative membrane protein [Tsukamurella ocularis]
MEGSVTEATAPSAPDADGPGTPPAKGATQYRYTRALIRARLRFVRAARDPDRFLRENYDEFAARHPLFAWAWSLLHLDFAGLFVGGLFLMSSLTVSLLPRSWFFQGIVSGINAVIGYAIGVFLKWVIVDLLVRAHPIRDNPRRARFVPVWRALIVLGVLLGGLAMMVAAKRWQDDVRALMGMPPGSNVWYVLTPIVAFLVSTVLISMFRVLRDLGLFLARRANRYLRVPQPAAKVLGFALVVVLVVFTVNDVGFRAFTATANTLASSTNDQQLAEFPQPPEAWRSGSEGSAAQWSGLGNEGRKFVSGGLRAAEIARFTTRPVTEPVRVYVGLENAGTPEDRIALVHRELARTGALDRRHVVVVPTTGSGWVNPTAARAVELMYDGDVALVAMQYSYLPSWISFLTDGEASLRSGKRLIDAVVADVRARPAPARPKLLVMGESLGSRAGEGAFAGLSDIRDKVDGVVWLGPPRANPIHSAITDRRDLGTPEVLPTYTDGLIVRFTDGQRPLTGDGGSGGVEWLAPHIVYVQHPSDPVVWWSPELILRQPDWLREPPGRDRSPAMAWYPFVTFWQVSADLANAAGVPDGHGHNYGTALVDAFAAVLPPAGWTSADTERVRMAVMASAAIDGAEK